jgi:hypothetical protein
LTRRFSEDAGIQLALESPVLRLSILFFLLSILALFLGSLGSFGNGPLNSSLSLIGRLSFESGRLLFVIFLLLAILTYILGLASPAFRRTSAS